MIQILNFFTLFFFLFWIIRNILFWLFLWQVKEYRLDRMLVHLKETNQGRLLFTHFGNIVKLVLILLYLFAFSLVDQNLLQTLVVLIFLVYTYDFFTIVKEVLSRKLKKPIFTGKTVALILCVGSLIFSLIPLLFENVFIIPIIDKLVPFFLAVGIAVSSIPSRIYHGFLIHRAKEKILLYPNLKVLGITGCYGKGSTKEYTATILKQKFHILKTFETHNTPIGIAQTILSHLTNKTDIFLVEIGAYKLGETEQICDIVRPTIAIITPVEDQHLSLFGSLENLKKGTFELIESLPSKNALALFDGNSFHTRELYKKTNDSKVEKILCFSQNTKGVKLEHLRGVRVLTPLVMAQNIIVEKFKVSFEVMIQNKKLGKFTAHLLGAHHIENIVPGIYLAHRFKISVQTIKQGVAKITPWKKTMEPFVNSSGAVLIDDTFNASPGATRAAVDYMSIYNGKKIFVLQPFIELGKNAQRDHLNIGKYIGSVCDHLILTNDNYLHQIQSGVQKSKKGCVVRLAQTDEIVECISTLAGKEDVVVFEGKEAGLALTRIKKFHP